MHSTICEDDRNQQQAVWSQVAIIGAELRCTVTSLTSAQTAAMDAEALSPWWSYPMAAENMPQAIDA